MVLKEITYNKASPIPTKFRNDSTKVVQIQNLGHILGQIKGALTK
jgi:hypothetical protein